VCVVAISYTWEVPVTMVSAADNDWEARPTHYLPFGDNSASVSYVHAKTCHSL